MRDRIDEGVVLFVATNLADHKESIQQDAAADHQHQQYPENQQDAMPPVQQEVADVKHQQNGDQPDAERDVPGNRPTASGKLHNSRVPRYTVPSRAPNVSEGLRIHRQPLTYVRGSDGPTPLRARTS